jgi:hypothetical protein
MAQPVTNKSLSRSQLAALEELVQSGSVKKAAGAAGVTPKTVYAWLKEPRFNEALRETEALAVQAVARRLVAMADRAVECVATGMDPNEDIRVRLRAADIYFTKAMAWLEVVELERRVAALEAQPDSGEGR